MTQGHHCGRVRAVLCHRAAAAPHRGLGIRRRLLAPPPRASRSPLSRSRAPPILPPDLDPSPSRPQLLFSALLRLRQHPALLAPTIHEPFLRQYQVLPGRAHPEMQGMASGGYVMSMVRVWENDEAQAVGMAGGGRGKRKAAAGAGGPRSRENAAAAARSGRSTPREGEGEGLEGGDRKRVKVEEGEEVKKEGGAADEAMQVDAEAPVAATKSEAA